MSRHYIRFKTKVVLGAEKIHFLETSTKVPPRNPTVDLQYTKSDAQTTKLTGWLFTVNSKHQRL